jgi:hypothetical protein
MCDKTAAQEPEVSSGVRLRQDSGALCGEWRSIEVRPNLHAYRENTPIAWGILVFGCMITLPLITNPVLLPPSNMAV